MLRRSLFKAIGAALGAAAVADPEELLWKPGKVFSIPPVVTPKVLVNVDHIITYDFLMNNSDRLLSEDQLIKRFALPAVKDIEQRAKSLGISDGQVLSLAEAGATTHQRGWSYERNLTVNGKAARMICVLDPVMGDVGRVSMLYRAKELW